MKIAAVEKEAFFKVFKVNEPPSLIWNYWFERSEEFYCGCDLKTGTLTGC